jgi:hypothetical protein
VTQSPVSIARGGQEVREFAGAIDASGFQPAGCGGNSRRLRHSQIDTPHWRHSEGTMKSKQSGVTLIGFLIIIVVVGFFFYMGMKLLPSYSEYMGVAKAMNQVATAGTNGKSLDEIRRDLMFKMGFQYVDDSTLKPSDITIKRDAGGASQLQVAYDKQIPFMYNIDFLLHFNKSVPLQGNVGQ